MKPTTPTPGIINEILFEIAKRVDNEYMSRRLDFKVERRGGLYVIFTDTADSCSLIRVYYDFDTGEINKVQVLGDYTDGWDDVRPETYCGINKILIQNGLKPIQP